MPYKELFKKKEAKRRYYQRNKKFVAQQVRLLELKKQQYIREQKIRPCMDCKKKYPYYVMEFDHKRDKVFMLSNGHKFSWDNIKKEIKKCDVICANCHRIRTHKRRVLLAQQKERKIANLEVGSANLP